MKVNAFRYVLDTVIFSLYNVQKIFGGYHDAET